MNKIIESGNVSKYKEKNENGWFSIVYITGFLAQNI